MRRPATPKEELPEPREILSKRHLTHFLNTDGELEKLYIEGADGSQPSKRHIQKTPKKRATPKPVSALESTAETRPRPSQSKSRVKEEENTYSPFSQPFRLDQEETGFYSNQEEPSVGKLFFYDLQDRKGSDCSGKYLDRPRRRLLNFKTEVNSDSENDPTYQPRLSEMIEDWGRERPHKKKLSKTGRGKIRGHYNMLNLEKRNEIVYFAKRFGIEKAYAKYRICKSRIRRYLNNGAMRKKGGGRKTLDPEMEESLLTWIAEATRSSQMFPTRGLIKSRAKSFSKVRTVLASKGWCDKFFKRNQDRLDGIRKSLEPKPHA